MFISTQLLVDIIFFMMIFFMIFGLVKMRTLNIFLVNVIEIGQTNQKQKTAITYGEESSYFGSFK